MNRNLQYGTQWPQPVDWCSPRIHLVYIPQSADLLNDCVAASRSGSLNLITRKIAKTLNSYAPDPLPRGLPRSNFDLTPRTRRSNMFSTVLVGNWIEGSSPTSLAE